MALGTASVSKPERLTTITAIPPQQWERLADASPFASHGWLRTLEQTDPALRRSIYFTERRQGRLVAGAPSRVETRTSAAVGLDRLLYGAGSRAARPLLVSVLPALAVGASRWGVGVTQPLLLDARESSVGQISRAAPLLQAIEEVAEAERLTVCLRGVGARQHALGEALAARGYLRTRELPVSYLDIEWDDFAGYLRHLKVSHPATSKNIRRELNLARRHGIAVERVQDLGRHARQIHHLLASHHNRLNNRPYPFGIEFLESLLRNLAENAEIWLASAGDTPLAAQVRVRDADDLHVTAIGIDPTLARRSQTYFNLGYNLPIRDAIDAGMRRVYFGTLVYPLKRRRGCKLLQSYMYVRGRGRLHTALMRPLFAYRDGRIARRTGVGKAS